ncbi:uncharacterized protein [Heterodontus francisci]|uniref:uncharacterized protein n=1 Tax=Heterodontus francisci TaxID=7792 RepID=UPI00355B56B7
MSQKEDLSEVTVSQTLSSWEIDRTRVPSQCERRLLSVLLVSVLLLFIIIASLVCAFWLLIYPKMTTGNKFAVHLLADVDSNKRVKWSDTPGMENSYLGSGFHFENQELHTTRDGMYYVYAKLKVYCSVLNQCKNSSSVKLDIIHCTEGNDCSSILSMKVKVSQEVEEKQEEQAAFGYSGTLVQISAKSLIRAKIEGLRQEDDVTPDNEHTYFGAFLIES